MALCHPSFSATGLPCSLAGSLSPMPAKSPPFDRQRATPPPRFMRKSLTRRTSRDLTSVNAAISQEIATAFSLATFAPQPLWLLMVLFPRSELTRKVFQPLWPILLLCLIHSYVVANAAQGGGAENIALFAEVFNPAGFPVSDGPFVGMQKLFQVPGFVAEEWPHVLLWDLFVGRYIWLDGLARDIPTPHSLLLTNFIGPPGLLLHALTCVVTGKPLPSSLPSPSVSSTEETSPSPPRTERADELVTRLFGGAEFDPEKIAENCAEDVVFEDLSSSYSEASGRSAALSALRSRTQSGGATDEGSQETPYVIERLAEGSRSTGFTWHRKVEGVEGKGLRGTTFVELDQDGKIKYMREIAEPLFKPGSSTEALLKAIANPSEEWLEANAPKFDPRNRRNPASAEEMVRYLWDEVNGADLGEVLRVFSEDIVYEDFNFPEPMRGKKQVEEFLNAFNIPGIKFVPERYSEGTKVACFTWHVEIAGIDGQQIRGVSLYEVDSDGNVSYIRDVAEGTVKPPPLLALATALRPGLRRFVPA